MEFFRPDIDINWMGRKTVGFTVASALTVLGLVGMVWPGANWGTDFSGGTELQIAFKKPVELADVRSTVASLGHGNPEVVSVAGSSKRYIVRIQEVSTIPPAKAKAAEKALRRELGGTKVHAFRLSPGGDRLAIQLSADADSETIARALESARLDVREVQRFGKPEEHRYEVFLVGIGDAIMDDLQEKLGRDVAPEAAESVDWVGPKAGAQLRNAGIKSLIYALLLMGIYIAFRFDLRFAPGALLAVIHSVAFALLVALIARLEVTLATVAAVLTVVGYSLNDTIIVYDRVRENLARVRDIDLERTINVSINETMSRTVNSVLATQITVVAIVIFTTGSIREFAIVLFFGFLAGVYSSVFVASPVTIWLDRYFFRRQAA